MKKQTRILLFAIVLIVNVVGGFLNNQLIDYLSKPLIVLTLTGYFLSQTNRIQSPLKKWILVALLFSWLGDVLLMFQQKDTLFFLLGLSSFLIAHIFYIIFFNRVRIKEKVKGNPWLLLIVAIYYAVLVILLSPYLGEMRLPVCIYGIVISLMFMLAMHMLFINNNIAGRWMMTGALSFVVSDSVLAVNKFYQPFEAAGAVIMLTYGLAQLFIVEGASRYISFNRKE